MLIEGKSLEISKLKKKDFPFFGVINLFVRDTHQAKRMRRNLLTSSFKVVCDGQIVGMASFDLNHKETKKGRLYIDTIYVRPDCRRQGLGTFIIQFCAHYAKQNGYDTVYLDFDHENPELLSFYRKIAEKVREAGGNALVDENGEIKQWNNPTDS